MADRVGRSRNMTGLASLLVPLLGWSMIGTARSQTRGQPTLRDMVQSVVVAERQASWRKPPFLYTSIEKSERTNGQVWTERVADIPQGKLRYLVAIDGLPLSRDRRAEEIARVRANVANPASFIRSEEARQHDEKQAQKMLELLPQAFSFEEGGSEGLWLRINYKPNPDYIPRTYEERALHGMSGMLLVDSHSRRLHQLSGRLDDDVTFGYGLLGTIRRGTNFTTTRDMIAPAVWKTTFLDAHIDGRVVIFKTISRNQHSVHQDFQALPIDITLSLAAELLIK